MGNHLLLKIDSLQSAHPSINYKRTLSHNQLEPHNLPQYSILLFELDPMGNWGSRVRKEEPDMLFYIRSAHWRFGSTPPPNSMHVTKIIK